MEQRWKRQVAARDIEVLNWWAAKAGRVWLCRWEADGPRRARSPSDNWPHRGPCGREGKKGLNNFVIGIKKVVIGLKGFKKLS